MAEKETDALSGTETTGHEWDGLKELNSPLPRWWLWTFYVTVAWAVIYTIAFPAWPTLSDYTRGVLGYSNRGALEETMAKVSEARAGWTARFEQVPVTEIAADPELQRYAMAGGRVIFGENCAPCHGSGGAGARGYPVLADDDWLWGGDVATIYQTVRFGVRADNDETRTSEMPWFSDDILTAEQIGQAADYVLSLSGQGGSAAGAEIFAENCAGCHGGKGEGMQEVGAPALADSIWLYGGDRASIVSQISTPKHGVMPAWSERLGDVAIKQVSVYVHALGGGQ